MAALYDSADIYLMSPNADNMPLSLLECFAAGLPVVSSNAGGIPNVVEDQMNGLLFAPDDHQAMAACALRLLDEPGLAARLAANARSECARYSWSAIGPQWIALYRRLLALPAAPFDQFRCKSPPCAAPTRQSKTARPSQRALAASCSRSTRSSTSVSRTLLN